MKRGVALSPEEKAALNSARDLARNSIAVANDMFGKLLTIDAALIGGGVVIAKGDVFPTWWAALVMVPLLLSFVSAFAGLMPKRDRIDLGNLQQVMNAYIGINERVHRKSDALFISVACLFIALALAFLGVLLRGLGAF